MDDIPKYRKKSSAKGQPRSKHKHCYEPVLLKRRYTYTDSTNGKLKTIFMERPTMVCPICRTLHKNRFKLSVCRISICITAF